MSKRDKQFSKPYATELDAFKTYANKHDISLYDFKLILKTFFFVLQKELISTGDIYSFPFRLGNISVRKKDTYGKGHFDYQYFKDTGLKRYIKNNHSSKYLAKFNWNTRWPNFEPTLPSALFSYSAPRDIKRLLAKAIKETNSIHKYYDL